eukprot:contig_3773_g821
MVLTDDTRPASSKLRKAELAEWLEAHDAVPGGLEADWRQNRTRAEMKEQADKHRPAPRFLEQDLAAQFDVTILIYPVALPELNPIEMVWGTVKAALQRTNIDFSLTRLKELVEMEFVRITPEVWGRYEDHAVKMEDYYWTVASANETEEAATDSEIEELEPNDVVGYDSSEDSAFESGSEMEDDD